MNAFEFSRKLEKITPDMIRKIGIEAVHENEGVIISDAIVSNIEGKTFAGNKISEYKPFTDWEETSRGDGAEAIFNTFPDKDTIAPAAKILSREAKNDIQESMIKKLKTL